MNLLFDITSTEASSNLEINIFLPAAVNNPSALTTFGNQLGVHFSSAKFYLDWSDDFESGIARGFSNQGVIPEVTWQPQSNGNGVSYPDVLAGKYDDYINNFARDIATFGSNIRINLAPEVNGVWEPWAVGNAGNTTSNFKDFYHYVVNKFRAQGANNADWIFAPNIHHWGETASYAALYPGGDYIDFVGLDGYNWGTTQSWSSWQSFADIFRGSYNDLVGVSGKNMIITEFASTELGGNKAQWITDMFRDIRSSFPKIIGITWFNINKETDWRINSSSSAMQAFADSAKGNYSMAYQPSTQGDDAQAQNEEQVPASSVSKNNSSTGQATTKEQVEELQKKEKYALPIAKTAFYDNSEVQINKAVKAATTIKKNYQNYFTKNNLILIKILLEFFLFAIVLIVAVISERPSLQPKKI